MSLATYNNKGMKEGMEKEKNEDLKKEGGCAVFKAGTGESPRACEMNKPAIGLGAIMWYVHSRLQSRTSYQQTP